jgi:hypothetical protein
MAGIDSQSLGIIHVFNATERRFLMGEESQGCLMPLINRINSVFDSQKKRENQDHPLEADEHCKSCASNNLRHNGCQSCLK